jgi:hypothetical protein
MNVDSSLLAQLPREECLRLMGTVPVGRIVYTRQALPAVELVNFTLVDGDIIIRTLAEGKLSVATRGAVVAFESDSVDLKRHAGWSVTIVGQARAVSDGAEVRRLDQLVPPSWATGEHDQFISIAPSIVNGRRIGGRCLTGRPSAHHL